MTDDTERIERLAEDILAKVPSWLWDGETLPLPVEDIADSCFGLLVVERDDLAAAPGAPKLIGDQTLSGLLLPAAAEIWVNAAEARQWPTRRRFTICHELGHHVLHHGEGEAVFCRHTSVEEADETPDPPMREEEANAFAAALLMPRRLVRRHYSRGMDFLAFCRQFDASMAAMGRRLHTAVPRSR